MARKNLLGEIEIVRHSNAVAAGTSTITPGTPIDMAGYDSCVFIAAFGTITASAVTSIEVHQCDTSGGTYAALTGTNIAVADDDDNQVAAVEVCRPKERYLKCIVNRATANAVLDGIIAIKYRGRQNPATQGATVVGTEIHVDVAEGAA